MSLRLGGLGPYAGKLARTVLRGAGGVARPPGLLGDAEDAVRISIVKGDNDEYDRGERKSWDDGTCQPVY